MSGTVSDSATGEKIPGVNVFIPELHKGSVTDIEGKYALENLPEGIFNVQFSFVGYESVIKSISLKENVILDIALEEAVIETHEIVVTAMYAAPQDETPVKVDQLSREQMSKKGNTSLVESISGIPGISQISTGAGIGKPVIRGLSSNRVVVYSQGIRIENQQWGSEHGLGVSDMGIERVEIVKGPASLLYGSDAMGGALHLVDEKPANAGKITGDYRFRAFSNTLGISNGLGIKGSGKIARFNVRANTQSHADYLTGDYKRVTNTRFSENELKASVGITKPRLVSNSAYNFIVSKLGIPEGIGKQGTEREIEMPYQQIQSHIISSQNTFFNGKSKFKTNFGYMLNNRKEFEEDEDSASAQSPEQGEEAALEMQLNTFNYDARWQYEPSEQGEIVLGLQGMSQTNKNSGKEALIPDAGVNDIGVVGLGHYHLEKMVLQLGLRYDNRKIITKETGEDFEAFTRNFQSVNASGGGVYKAVETGHALSLLLFRFNAASGFRAPNLSELSSNGVHEGTFRYETGNNNLKKEQNFQVDISSHFHSKHIAVDVAAFHNSLMDYIFISPTDSVIEQFLVYEYLQENAALYGGEFTIDVHPHPMDWLHFESSFSTVTGKLKSGGFLPLIPANKMQNSIIIEIADDKDFVETYFNIGITSVSAQRNVAEEESSTPAYNLVSIGMGSKVKLGKQQASFSFTVNNLLNEKYYDHLSRLRYYGIYNAGRNMVFSVNVPFGVKG